MNTYKGYDANSMDKISEPKKNTKNGCYLSIVTTICVEAAEKDMPMD
jgi:hypothetical protein